MSLYVTDREGQVGSFGVGGGIAFFTSRSKHRSANDRKPSDRSSGTGGGSVLAVMWKRAAMWLLNSLKGGLPLAIWRTVHPTLQISDFFE